MDIATGKTLSGVDLRAGVAGRQQRLAPLLGEAARPALIVHGGSADFFADLFAVWSLGGCAACISPELTSSQFETVADFLRPSVVLAAEHQHLPNDFAGAPILRLTENARDQGSRRLTTTPADRPALILFTSGTTGAPKGVVHTFGSLAARIALNLEHIPAGDLAHTLCGLPTHFGHGLIGNCLTALAAGGALHLMGDRLSRVPLDAGALIDAHAITFMSSVPTLWKVALKTSKPPGKATLKRLHVGSAPLGAELWTRIRKWSGIDAVVNMYGITETANWIAGADPRLLPIEDGMVGTMWGGEIAVFDGDGHRHARGEGEIAVRTPSLMQGYWQRPDLTAAAMRDGWYLTGDSGIIDDQGIVRLRGRRKDEINRAGMKVQPAEIDMLLERHPEVAEACCFGIADDILGEKIGVAVCALPGQSLDIDALRQWCRSRLHAAAVPERWFTVSDIPKTDRGKIKRDEVMRHCLAQANSGKPA
ncbi:MAG: fatty acid--CoA ligase family protein [Rhodospirillales bacterium]